MTKVLVIGLDGGTWDLIKPWAEGGELPTFKKLMENGAWGALESTIPPATCPAWPSMLTGKKPDRLGLYYFTRRDSKGYNPMISRTRPLTGSIWQIINRYGKRCSIINVPMSELFEKDDINGVFVADPVMNTGKITDQTHIKSLIEDIGYKVEAPSFEEGKEKTYLKEVIQRSKKQFLLVEKLLNEDWALLFYVIFWTDQVSHLYWKYLDEKHPEYQDNEEITSLIKRFYKEIDQFLELILDKTSNLFIVSDHGFGPLYYEINLNQWLAQEGFMTKRIASSPKSSLVKENLIAWLKRIGSKPLIKPFAKKMAPFVIPDYGKSKSIFENAPIIDLIDWSKTKAYSIYYGGININLKGREPAGIVRLEEYESVRQEIIEKTLQIKDPDGREVVEKAWKVEEIYKNPSPDSFPDIILKFKDFSKYRNRVDINLGLSDNLFTKSLESGSHKLEGIFLAYDPRIKKGYKIEGAKIYDIAPTILHIFGIPIPKDMDGKVLKEIFKEDSEFAKREIVYQEVEDETEKISKKIKELKSLGKI